MKTTINKIVATVMQPQFIKAAYIFIVIVLLMTNQLHAQAADPGDVDPDAVPLDGGLSLLVAAGVGYGAKKMKERKNKSL
jgi:hypothetical protein